MPDNSMVDQGQKPNYPTEVVMRLMENQSRELEVKARELELQDKECQNTHAYSMRDLEIKDKVLSQYGSNNLKIWYGLFSVVTIIAVALSVLVGLCVIYNQTSVALEILKSLALLIAGGFGGYGIRGFRQEKKEENS